MAEIVLNCWILGDTASFPVNIVPSKNVGHLKDAIKEEEEPVLNHIAAGQLEIWKVNDPRTAYPPSLMCSDATRFAAQETPFECGNRQHTWEDTRWRENTRQR